jgi:hypothetical protein
MWRRRRRRRKDRTLWSVASEPEEATTPASSERTSLRKGCSEAVAEGRGRRRGGGAHGGRWMGEPGSHVRDEREMTFGGDGLRARINKKLGSVAQTRVKCAMAGDP